MNGPSALVVAGFHRSGTSLTARRLQAAGFPLGAHLLLPHPSNPEGHFEDSTVVAFDDAWLARQRTDWLFHDDVPLPIDARLRDDLRAYVAARDAAGVAWAVKDPRLCLALPAWADELGERGRWLVVIRHWAECAQSLLHRHSREMLFGALPAGHAHFRLWREPFLAHRAWLATSRRLLAFAAARPATSVIATTRAIAALPSLDPLLERLGMPAPQAETGATVRDELLQRRTLAALLPPPPPALRAALDATWEQLLTLAEWRTGDEAVAWDRRRAPAYVRAAIDAAVTAIAGTPEPVETDPVPIAGAARRDVDDALARIALLPPSRVTPLALADGRRVLRQNDPDGAERIARAGLARTKVPHPLWLLLGDIEMARERWPEAVDAYRRSHALKASEHATLKLARGLAAAGDWREVVALLDPLIGATPDRVDALVLRALALERIEGPDAAVHSLAGAPAHPDIVSLHGQLALATSPLAALRAYEARIRARLQDVALAPWLAAASRASASVEAWEGFVEAIWRHGARLLGEREFAARLGAVLPPPADRYPASRPVAAIAASESLLADAGASALRAAGWRIDAGEHPGFDVAFAGVAAADDTDDPDTHAARVAFLQDALPADAATLAGWGWQHASTLRFAEALLAVVPTLAIAWLHAGAAPALSGWPQADAVPHVGTDRRASLEHWLADWRRAEALQARWPGRFALVDLRHPEAAAIAWRTLFGDEAGAPPSLPPAIAQVLAAPPSTDTLDPRDVTLLRERGLL